MDATQMTAAQAVEAIRTATIGQGLRSAGMSPPARGRAGKEVQVLMANLVSGLIGVALVVVFLGFYAWGFTPCPSQLSSWQSPP